jgi:Zn-dependent peptidase ImmA (M78 family)
MTLNGRGNKKMLELETCYSFSQVPFITYEALEAYAEKLVQDFAPSLLHNPGIIDVDEFLEYYLHLTVDFRRICYNRKILGITAFNDGMVDIFDEETGKPDEILVKKGTVIIDTSLTTKRNEPRLRFTGIHEGCHWLIHRKAFASDNPFGPAGIYANQYLAAKEGRGDYIRSQKERTDIERMERQADFLASAILMPRPALREVYREFFKYYGEKPRRIIRRVRPLDDCYADHLPEYVAKIFNVSKRAALIRLEKLTAIVDNGKGYSH